MGLFDRLRSAAPPPGKPDTSGQDATRLIDQGHALEAQGKLDEAMQCYREAIRLAPNPARGHLNRGNVLLLQGDLDGALDAFRTALELQPDYAGAYYNIGNALLGNRQFDAAVASYRKALAINPDYAEVHCSLGVALKELGQMDEAVACFRRALQIAPGLAEAQTNLGLALQHYYNTGNLLLNAGKPEDAATNFRNALAIEPNLAEAHYNLGNALKGLGQNEDAAASYRRAIEIKPDFAEAHGSLGNVLKQNGRLADAVASYRRVLEIKPDYAEAHNNLGNALKDLGQLEDAVASYQLALKIKPDYTEAHNNLGNALKDLGQLEDAIASYQLALKIKPDFAEAHNNLGVALYDLGQLAEAEASCRRSLEIKPDYAEAYNNLGNMLKDIGRIENAMASYRRALEIKPDYAEAYSNLGNALKDIGQFGDAIGSYQRALEIKPGYTEARDGLLFTLNYDTRHTPSYHLEQARQYGHVVAAKVGVRFTSWRCTHRPERLRVGLVSGDMRKHSVGYFLEGLLAHIDPSRIELIAYPTHHQEDELTARIRPYFSAWHPLVGKNDETAARLIHADGVHILFDLSGHTAHNRLPVFAWKPAPVQVSWLGLPATTGVAEMDYVLGDSWAIPAEFENQFSEAVWRMPESYICLTVPSQSVDIVPPPALITGRINFGSFNNLAKMNDAVVAVWSNILQSVPKSRLLLKTKQLSDAVICKQTFQRFAARGIAPDRLLLGGILASRDEHLAAYNKVDIALDTFPYPGVTTSAEALWMGVPVLSMQGNSFLSCTAASIANNAGLPDWVAADEADYVAKAVAYASDLERLAALRSVLREQVLASPLFDAPRFARNFEDALWGMWARYQAQQEPPEIS